MRLSQYNGTEPVLLSAAAPVAEAAWSYMKNTCGSPGLPEHNSSAMQGSLFTGGKHSRRSLEMKATASLLISSLCFFFFICQTKLVRCAIKSILK